MHRLSTIAAGFAGLCFTAAAHSEAVLDIEQVFLKPADAFEPRDAVVGELRIPPSPSGRLPAVVIVNSTPGFDGRGAFYAQAFNEAAIATFEIDMFQGRGAPASARHNMPHVYAALRYLSRHARVDAERVGVMGFSYGGTIAMLAASEELARRYGGAGLRYAAHLALYPICWRQRGVLAGKSRTLAPGIYRRVTGAPVHILVGSEDGYDGQDSCTLFLSEMHPAARQSFALTVYEGATFAWDSRFGWATYEAGGRQGQGGVVTVVADPEVADRSRAFALGFFGRHLGAR
jgi:dienelactone hydrolase